MDVWDPALKKAAKRAPRYVATALDSDDDSDDASAAGRTDVSVSVGHATPRPEPTTGPSRLRALGLLALVGACTLLVLRHRESTARPSMSVLDHQPGEAARTATSLVPAPAIYDEVPREADELTSDRARVPAAVPTPVVAPKAEEPWTEKAGAYAPAPAPVPAPVPFAAPGARDTPARAPASMPSHAPAAPLALAPSHASDIYIKACADEKPAAWCEQRRAACGSTPFVQEHCALACGLCRLPPPPPPARPPPPLPPPPPRSGVCRQNCPRPVERVRLVGHEASRESGDGRWHSNSCVDGSRMTMCLPEYTDPSQDGRRPGGTWLSVRVPPGTAIDSVSLFLYQPWDSTYRLGSVPRSRGIEQPPAPATQPHYSHTHSAQLS